MGEIIIGVLFYVIIALPYEVFDLDQVFKTPLVISLALILYGIVFIIIEHSILHVEKELISLKRLNLARESEIVLSIDSIVKMDYKIAFYWMRPNFKLNSWNK